MNFGVGISTYFNEEILKSGRLEVFKKSINSLLKTNVNDIYVVDDNSPIQNHIEYIISLGDPRINIVLKDTNGGISKTKNTCIRKILEKYEYGFLCDDDILYKDQNWAVPYVDIMQNTIVQHLSFYDSSWYGTNSNIIPLNIDNFLIKKTNMVQGAMLTFSKKLIDFIGYFKILENKIGHEHTNFTNRAIYYGLSYEYIDVYNSNELLALIDTSGITSTRLDKTGEDLNIKYLHTIPYENCIE